MKLATVTLVLAGCGFGPSSNAINADGGGGDGAASNDAGCQVAIAITPQLPQVGDHVHASVVLSGAQGVPTYAWTLDGSAATAYEAPDDSAIGFDPSVGPHTVAVTLGNISSSCLQGQLAFNVSAASGADAVYRLRVIAPNDLAPPYETSIVVHAGTPAERDVELEPGEAITGSVTGGAAGVPAYMQWFASSGPAIETYAALTGAFAANVAVVPYQVDVVPEVPNLAPRAFAWMYPMPATFALDAGQTITGTVLVGGAAVAGAQVQLASGGLPSTLATSDSNGNFTALATFTAGAQVTVSVVPPATSGLPRLTATSPFDLTQPLQIAYGAATPCDLGGDAVQRGGTALANARVTIVGAPATTATIGGLGATASVVASATANASGVLPSLPVPRAAVLSAIVQASTSDFAVATIDTSSCAAQPIVAPAMTATTGKVTLNATALANARVEATPTGALAVATLVPVDAMTGSDGSFTLALAAGGSYETRITDARAAPFDQAGVPSTIQLVPVIASPGTISLDGAGVVPGASVELLCGSCTGVDADRPIAQAAADAQGGYQLTVADPAM